MKILEWFRNRKLLRDYLAARKEHKERYETPWWWHISNARNDFKFDHFSRYDEALEELRDRVPGALIVHVDWELHVILFKTATR